MAAPREAKEATSHSSSSERVKRVKSFRQEWQEFEPAGKTSDSSDSTSRRLQVSRLTYLIAAAILFVLFTILALMQSPRPVPHPVAGLSDSVFWRYPIVINDIKRLPEIVIIGASTSPTLNAVWASADGKNVWVAGDSGVLLHSADGGRTWERLPPEQSQQQGAQSNPSR